jgi:isoquinoline 1-oxidoreductase subunit alpha
MQVKVNRQDRSYEGDPQMPLLWYLRDELGMTGTKFGCGVGLCEVSGKAVTTIEGLSLKTTGEGVSSDGNHPVQKAWRAHNVPQCGYCQTGQIMQAAALLAEKKKPSDAEIISAMSGNICRCGCYQRIFAAVKDAAKEA